MVSRGAREKVLKLARSGKSSSGQAVPSLDNYFSRGPKVALGCLDATLQSHLCYQEMFSEACLEERWKQLRVGEEYLEAS